MTEKEIYMEQLAAFLTAGLNFWMTTDDHPLIGLTDDQGDKWDLFCEAAATSYELVGKA